LTFRRRGSELPAARLNPAMPLGRRNEHFVTRKLGLITVAILSWPSIPENDSAHLKPTEIELI